MSLQMLHGLGLQNIEVRFLPADIAYEHYLSGKKLNVAALML